MELTKEQLIAGCRAGTHSAQLALYNRYSKWLYGVCFRILACEEEAEEAMQDSFLKIYTRMNQFREQQSFEAWIKRIAAHTAIDYVRRRQVLFENVDDVPDMTDEEASVEDEQQVELTVQKIKDAMRLLPNGYRAVLSLYLFEGYDTEEIAEILDVKPVSVRSQYMRAKKKIIELLNEGVNHG